MTNIEQIYVEIKENELIKKAQDMKENGYRLAQISCTKTDVWDLIYSFAKDLEFINVRIILTDNGTSIKSISGIYPYAFIYENEIKELFEVNITDIAIDFKGNFYKTSVKAAFNTASKN